jgi:hypothetical protein
MSKIIVRGNVVINVYVNSPEQVNEVTESAKSLAEILKGGIVTEMPKEISDQIRELVKSADGECRCNGCQMRRRIEAMGMFTDGDKTFENLPMGLDEYGFINEGMDREDLIGIINSYADTIESDGQIEVGAGKFLKPVVPLSAVTH